MSWIADVLMVFGPVVGYVFQYKLIKTTQSVGNFSIDVCAILLTSNILRIFYWYAVRFSVALLLQAMLMSITQLLLLKLCVKIRNQQNDINQTAQSKIVQYKPKQTKKRFWRWNRFESYILFLAVYSFVTGLMTLTFVDFVKVSNGYGNIIGFLSLAIEATLGFPQMIQNFCQKSVLGLSIFLIMTWFFGDLAKTIYFIIFEQPFQFIICGCFQLSVDLIILVQLFVFRNKSLLTQQQADSIQISETPPTLQTDTEQKL